MKAVLFILILSISKSCSYGQLSSNTIERITSEVNKVRAKGLMCGNTRMPPVHAVQWNDKLYEVSLEYATYMNENRHFAHVSKDGEDAGMRLDEVGYNWRYVGENIAMGQYDFPEVLQDWIESESHCKMLMSKNMKHFAVARNKKYWVQTFATPMRDSE